MARNEAHIVDKGDKIVDHIVVVQEQRRRPVTIWIIWTALERTTFLITKEQLYVLQKPASWNENPKCFIHWEVYLRTLRQTTYQNALQRWA